MLRVMFSENPRVDTLVKRWVGVGVLISMTVAFTSWFSGILDPWIATEPEVVERLLEHDDHAKHAGMDNVNHLANMMVDEQVGDAIADVKEIEDLEDLGEATSIQIREKIRLQQRIEREFRPRYLCEPGLNEQHYELSHQWMPKADIEECIKTDRKDGR